MTELKIYMVYDSKTEVFGQPVFEETRRDAEENWRLVASDDKDDKNKVAKFPGDFTLFEIGVYDRRTGVISMYETKVNLGTALQAKKIKK